MLQFWSAILKPKPLSVYGIDGIRVYKSKEHDMKIVLLQDTHTLEHRCKTKEAISAADFVERLIENSAPFMVDLYLETHYKFEPGWKIRKPANFMDVLEDNLEDCFEFEKIGCKYSNLRAHYVDYRSILEDPFVSGRTFNRAYFDFTTRILAIKRGAVMREDIEFLQTAVAKPELRRVFKSGKTLRSFMMRVLKETKFLKQVGNIKDRKIRNLIHSLMDKWLNEGVHWAQELRLDRIEGRLKKLRPVDEYYNRLRKREITREQYLESIKPIKQHNESIIYRLYWVNAIIRGILLDLYLIARLFRSYEPRLKKIRGTWVRPKYYEKAHNVIVYAGSAHTRRVEELLRELDFKLVHWADEDFAKTKIRFHGSGPNCVDIQQNKTETD